MDIISDLVFLGPARVSHITSKTLNKKIRKRVGRYYRNISQLHLLTRYQFKMLISLATYIFIREDEQVIYIKTSVSKNSVYIRPC